MRRSPTRHAAAALVARTASSLHGSDSVGIIDIYDARAGGGFPPPRGRRCAKGKRSGKRRGKVRCVKRGRAPKSGGMQVKRRREHAEERRGSHRKSTRSAKRDSAR